MSNVLVANQTSESVLSLRDEGNNMSTQNLENKIVDTFAALAEDVLSNIDSVIIYLHEQNISFRLPRDDDDREELKKLAICTLIQQFSSAADRIKWRAIERIEELA